jgi:hypothetical protein
LEKVFNYFDHDKDEAITYADFVQTIGFEIHPAESLFFRQDKKVNELSLKCNHPACWENTKG